MHARSAVCKFGLLFAYPPCNVVQVEALRAADGLVHVVVKSRTEEKQLALRACVETPARGLCQRRKTVVLEDDFWETGIGGRPHDGSLLQKSMVRQEWHPCRAGRKRGGNDGAGGNQPPCAKVCMTYINFILRNKGRSDVFSLLLHIAITIA